MGLFLLGGLASDRAALDSLNASGKMIGIIRNAETIKERIPAQIKVEERGGVGHSRLAV